MDRFINNFEVSYDKEALRGVCNSILEYFLKNRLDKNKAVFLEIFQNIKIIFGEEELINYLDSIGADEKIRDSFFHINLKGSSGFAPLMIKNTLYPLIYFLDSNLDSSNLKPDRITLPDIFIEEISHCVFFLNQILLNQKSPHKVFTELIAVLDKQFYYLVNSSNEDEFLSAIKRVDSVKDSLIEILGKEEEEHYYFAYKWGILLFEFLVFLQKEKKYELKNAIFAFFYHYDDSFRINFLLFDFPKIAIESGFSINLKEAFLDTENPQEFLAFKRIMNEI